MSTLVSAKEDDYLYLATSQIGDAGTKLFTAVKIYSEEVICLFHGEILSQSEQHRRFLAGDDSYFIDMNDGTVMDCAHIEGKAKYANDVSGPSLSKFLNNSYITFDDDDRVCLTATRNIASGEEIFCSYGRDYWKNFRKHAKKTRSSL